jgi:membrane protein insertase Oxa1/YidC/SpoIIIJ
MELLELYKKEKVNPVGSCLPLLLQFPLLIVLYWVISGIASISNYYYLYSPLAGFDITKINSNFF